jgi:hypothetical protein
MKAVELGGAGEVPVAGGAAPAQAHAPKAGRLRSWSRAGKGGRGVGVGGGCVFGGRC